MIGFISINNYPFLYNLYADTTDINAIITAMILNIIFTSTNKDITFNTRFKIKDMVSIVIDNMGKIV